MDGGEHHFNKSLKFNAKLGCPSGYHKRRGYTVKKTRTYVPPRCIKSTTVYAESSANFKKRESARMNRRLGTRVSKNKRKCPPGQISRKAYVRKMSSAVKARGYTVKRSSGSNYRVYPKKNTILVRASCIKNRGAPGKGAPGIGPLRKGELRKHGYIYRLPREQRHSALKMAVLEFGALGVYRKLDAVAKLSAKTNPEASRAFAEDRDWVKITLGPLKAF